MPTHTDVRRACAVAMLGAVTASSRGEASAAGVSAEIDVGDRIEWTAPAHDRSVTFDGCEMVVLANRACMTSDDEGFGLGSVFASRVSLDGSVRDPRGIPVSLPSALGASNGGEIVTLSPGPGPFGVPSDYVPSFSRLGPDLEFLGRREMDLPSGFQGTLACRSGGCLLLGRSASGPFDVRLVDYTGAKMAAGLLSATEGGWLSPPLAVPSRGGYFVAFLDQVRDGVQGLYGAQILANQTSKVTPRLVREIPGRPLYPLSLVSGGPGFLLVAEDWPTTGQTTPVRLVAVPADGTPEIVLGADSFGHDVDAFGTDDHFVVAFRQKAFGATPAGDTTIAVLGQGKVTKTAAEARAFGPAVATPKGRFLLDELLSLHRIRDDGTETGAPIPTMRTHRPEWWPSLVPGDRNLLLTYQDRDATVYRWHALRVDASGAPLDPAEAPVLTRPVPADDQFARSPPRIEAAFDGANYVLGWLDEASKPWLEHEDPRTGARDAPVSPVGLSNSDFHLHSGPRAVLATWKEGRSCGEDCGEDRLVALPLDRALHPLLAAPVVLVDWNGTLIGDVGPADFDGVRWVVPRTMGSDLFASTVTETGDVTSADVYRYQSSSFTVGPRAVRPRLAWTGTEHLFVFEADDRDATTQVVTSRILAIRADRNLAPLDAVPFSISSAAVAPEVVFDGARFLVAFVQGFADGSDMEVGATFVSPDGTVTEDDCFFASNTPFSESSATLAALPAAAGDASGPILVGYSRLDPDPELVCQRVKLRRIDPAGDTAPRCASRVPAAPPSAPFVKAGCGYVAEDDTDSVAKISGGCGCSVEQAEETGQGSVSAGIVAALLLLRRRRSTSSWKAATL